MRKFLSVIAVSLGLASFTAPAKADIAIGVGVSTLGYGVHVAASMTDFIAVRFNANFGEMDVPGVGLLSNSLGGIEYDVDASFGTYGLLADFHPLALSPIGAGLVLSGGVYYNNNEFDFTADPTTDVMIGGQTLPAGSARIIGTMSFDTKWAPYVGLGYDGTFQGFVPVSFFITGGVLFQGSPSVGLTTNDTTFNGLYGAELDAEAAQMEAGASSFEYYPVFAMCMTISF
jgi:hypothetical protein